jgi:hypothetical protein
MTMTSTPLYRGRQLDAPDHVRDALHSIAEILAAPPSAMTGARLSEQLDRLAAAGAVRERAEHIVSDPSGAATPNTPWVVPGWVAAVAADWMTAAQPLRAVTTWVDLASAPAGRPTFPVLPAAIVADVQVGEKQPVPSEAFDIGGDQPDATTVALMVNASRQLLAVPLAAAILRAALDGAVAAKVDAVVGAAIVDATATPAADLGAAFEAFEGPDATFTPRAVAGPPSRLLDLDVERLQAMGFSVVADSRLSAVVVLDPSAVYAAVTSGWLAADDPALLGQQQAAYAICYVSVNDAGAVAVA